MKNGFLAGLSAHEFMRRHWQRAPLLARKALPEYATALPREQGITKHTLFELAARGDVESRIVLRSSNRWSVRHGPFSRRDFARLPARNWTLLVQGVEQSLPQAARLMREFAFLPHARLDDVMVSYAAPGGGVGPHFDSYDVFLLQTFGRRRWRIGRQSDLELKPDTPVKILARFTPDREWIVEPGDLLYLPPQYAHDGIAIDECITCSIGFRAPAARELASAFLDFVHDGLDLEGRYGDRGRAPTRVPGRLPQDLVDYTESVVNRVRWSRADVARFVGCYLTEPKSNVVFERSRRPLSASAFAKGARSRGVRLAPPTRMLVRGRDVYMNGERLRLPRASKALAALANMRELPPGAGLGAALASVLYAWYKAGYIEITRS